MCLSESAAFFYYFIYLLATYNKITAGVGEKVVKSLSAVAQGDNDMKKLVSEFGVSNYDNSKYFGSGQDNQYTRMANSLDNVGDTIHNWDVDCAHMRDLFFIIMTLPEGDPTRTVKPSSDQTERALKAYLEKLKRAYDYRSPFNPLAVMTAIGGLASQAPNIILALKKILPFLN